MAITNNTEKNRFELDVDGEITFANYKIENSVLYINYVEAPPKLRGTGAASKLMEEVMDIARYKKYRVVPVCGYAVSWLKRHQEYQDVLA